jgi:hypothetical protein
MFFEVYVGVGTRNVVTAEAAADGGTNNIVSVSRLGSVSVWNSGITTSASRRSNCKASDATAAHGFRCRD